MGGRGGSSGLIRASQNQGSLPQQPQQPQPQIDIQLQPGDDLQTQAQASATLAQIAQMSDDQLAQAVIDSKGVDMPNFLNDALCPTQKFVYQVGLNGAPLVMDRNAFDQFMQQNNIPKSNIMERSVKPNGPYTAQHIIDIFKYSEMNYIGGKFGGSMSGAGTYFDQNGGSGGTGYGNTTLTAVLNPATARAIDYDVLWRKATSFAASHPKFTKAVGGLPTNGATGNVSIWALAMGYNVITGGPISRSYRNVIDRSAVIVVK